MTFKAPFRFLRIMSIAITGGHPLFTKASATKSGALPRPATQCTPILPSFEIPTYFCLRVVVRGTTGSYLLSSTWIISSVFCSSPPTELISAFSVSCFCNSFASKNSLTIFSHFEMTASSGSYPSGKFNTYTSALKSSLALPEHRCHFWLFHQPCMFRRSI